MEEQEPTPEPAISSEAGASAAALKDGNNEGLVAGSKANAQIGVGGAAANAGASLTSYQHKNNKGGVEVMKADVGGGVGAGLGGVKAKVDAGVTLVGANAKFGKGQELKSELRVNADTGVDIGAGSVAGSVAGFGGSIGRNMAIKTPVGSISFKLW